MLRITAPHFVAAIDYVNGTIAPILAYMSAWTPEMVVDYCLKKGWTVEAL